MKEEHITTRSRDDIKRRASLSVNDDDKEKMGCFFAPEQKQIKKARKSNRNVYRRKKRRKPHEPH